MSERIIESHLKSILKERGITQHQLSELTGVRVATINAICNNEMKRFPKEALESIVDVLNINDINDLISIKKTT